MNWNYGLDRESQHLNVSNKNMSQCIIIQFQITGFTAFYDVNLQAISEKIISLNNGGNIEVTSVDAQKSPNRDIHILVTGYETGRDDIVRDFVQTFLLALMETGRMEKGYYVLHDMFRYVGRSNQLGINQVKEVEQGN